MSDLISRQAAIKAIKDLQDCPNGFSDTYDKACIIGVIEEVHSATGWTPEVPREKVLEEIKGMICKAKNGFVRTKREEAEAFRLAESEYSITASAKDFVQRCFFRDEALKYQTAVSVLMWVEELIMGEDNFPKQKQDEGGKSDDNGC